MPNLLWWLSISISVIGLGFLTAFLWASSLVIDKMCVSSNPFDSPLEITIFGFISLSPLLFVLFVIENISLNPGLHFIILCLFIGVIYFFGMFLYLVSMDLSDSTSIAVLLRFSVVILIMLDIFVLNVSFSINELVGMFLILFGSILVSIDFNKNGKFIRFDRVIIYMFIMTILYALRLFTMDRAVEIENSASVYFYLILFAIMTSIIFIVLSKNVRNNILDSVVYEFSHSMKWIVVSRNVAGIGVIIYLLALVDESVSIVTTITSTQPIFVLILIIVVNIIYSKNSFYKKLGVSDIMLYVVSVTLVILGTYFIYI